MGNPILDLLGKRQQPPQSNSLVELYKTMQSMSNPKDALATLMQKNPMVQQAVQLINESNKSPKELFYSMAQQRGVDPEQILSMFK